MEQEQPSRSSTKNGSSLDWLSREMLEVDDMNMKTYNASLSLQDMGDFQLAELQQVAPMAANNEVLQPHPPQVQAMMNTMQAQLQPEGVVMNNMQQAQPHLAAPTSEYDNNAKPQRIAAMVNSMKIQLQELEEMINNDQQTKQQPVAVTMNNVQQAQPQPQPQQQQHQAAPTTAANYNVQTQQHQAVPTMAANNNVQRQQQFSNMHAQPRQISMTAANNKNVRRQSARGWMNNNLAQTRANNFPAQISRINNLSSGSGSANNNNTNMLPMQPPINSQTPAPSSSNLAAGPSSNDLAAGPSSSNQAAGPNSTNLPVRAERQDIPQIPFQPGPLTNIVPRPASGTQAAGPSSMAIRSSAGCQQNSQIPFKTGPLINSAPPLMPQSGTAAAQVAGPSNMNLAAGPSSSNLDAGSSSIVIQNTGRQQIPQIPFQPGPLNNTVPPPVPRFEAAAEVARQSIATESAGNQPIPHIPDQPGPLINTVPRAAQVAGLSSIEPQSATNQQCPQIPVQQGPNINRVPPPAFRFGSRTQAAEPRNTVQPKQYPSSRLDLGRTPMAAVSSREEMMMDMYPMFATAGHQDLGTRARHTNNLAQRQQARNNVGRPRGSRNKRSQSPRWSQQPANQNEAGSSSRSVSYRGRRKIDTSWNNLRLSGVMPRHMPVYPSMGEPVVAMPFLGAYGRGQGFGFNPNHNQQMLEHMEIEPFGLPSPGLNDFQNSNDYQNFNIVESASTDNPLGVGNALPQPQMLPPIANPINDQNFGNAPTEVMPFGGGCSSINYQSFGNAASASQQALNNPSFGGQLTGSNWSFGYGPSGSQHVGNNLSFGNARDHQPQLLPPVGVALAGGSSCSYPNSGNAPFGGQHINSNQSFPGYENAQSEMAMQEQDTTVYNNQGSIQSGNTAVGQNSNGDQSLVGGATRLNTNLVSDNQNFGNGLSDQVLPLAGGSSSNHQSFGTAPLGSQQVDNSRNPACFGIPPSETEMLVGNSSRDQTSTQSGSPTTGLFLQGTTSNNNLNYGQYNNAASVGQAAADQGMGGEETRLDTNLDSDKSGAETLAVQEGMASKFAPTSNEHQDSTHFGNAGESSGFYLSFGDAPLGEEEPGQHSDSNDIFISFEDSAFEATMLGGTPSRNQNFFLSESVSSMLPEQGSFSNNQSSIQFGNAPLSENQTTDECLFGGATTTRTVEPSEANPSGNQSQGCTGYVQTQSIDQEGGFSGSVNAAVTENEPRWVPVLGRINRNNQTSLQFVNAPPVEQTPEVNPNDDQNLVGSVTRSNNQTWMHVGNAASMVQEEGTNSNGDHSLTESQGERASVPSAGSNVSVTEPPSTTRSNVSINETPSNATANQTSKGSENTQPGVTQGKGQEYRSSRGQLTTSPSSQMPPPPPKAPINRQKFIPFGGAASEVTAQANNSYNNQHPGGTSHYRAQGLTAESSNNNSTKINPTTEPMSAPSYNQEPELPAPSFNLQESELPAPSYSRESGLPASINDYIVDHEPILLTENNSNASTILQSQQVQVAHQGSSQMVASTSNHQDQQQQQQLNQQQQQTQQLQQQKAPASADNPRRLRMNPRQTRYNLRSLNRPSMHRHRYPGSSSRQHSLPPAGIHTSMDLNQCPLPPSAFGEKVANGRANLLAGAQEYLTYHALLQQGTRTTVYPETSLSGTVSIAPENYLLGELWPTLQQPVSHIGNSMSGGVGGWQNSPLNPSMLNERVTQINKGRLQLPNLLPQTRVNPDHQAGLQVNLHQAGPSTLQHMPHNSEQAGPSTLPNAGIITDNMMAQVGGSQMTWMNGNNFPRNQNEAFTSYQPGMNNMPMQQEFPNMDEAPSAAAGDYVSSISGAFPNNFTSVNNEASPRYQPDMNNMPMPEFPNMVEAPAAAASEQYQPDMSNMPMQPDFSNLVEAPAAVSRQMNLPASVVNPSPSALNSSQQVLNHSGFAFSSSESASVSLERFHQEQTFSPSTAFHNSLGEIRNTEYDSLLGTTDMDVDSYVWYLQDQFNQW